MFHPLFAHNNKYFSPKIWEMLNNAKADVNRRFFLENTKKLHFCFTDPKLLTSVFIFLRACDTLP